MSTDVVVVMVTAPSEDVAAKLANALLDEKLIACANVLPGIRSFYEWEGKRVDEREVLMLLKTQRSRFDELNSRIKQLHPYAVPEVLRVDVAAGNAEYLKWVSDSTALPPLTRGR